jgi:hypothetical protein
VIAWPVLLAVCLPWLRFIDFPTHLRLQMGTEAIAIGIQRPDVTDGRRPLIAGKKAAEIFSRSMHKVNYSCPEQVRDQWTVSNGFLLSCLQSIMKEVEKVECSQISEGTHFVNDPNCGRISNLFSELKEHP